MKVLTIDGHTPPPFSSSVNGNFTHTLFDRFKIDVRYGYCPIIRKVYYFCKVGYSYPNYPNEEPCFFIFDDIQDIKEHILTFKKLLSIFFRFIVDNRRSFNLAIDSGQYEKINHLTKENEKLKKEVAKNTISITNFFGEKELELVKNKKDFISEAINSYVKKKSKKWWEFWK